MPDPATLKELGEWYDSRKEIIDTVKAAVNPALLDEAFEHSKERRQTLFVSAKTIRAQAAEVTLLSNMEVLLAAYKIIREI